jgi:propanediol dehydratase small subunit
MSRADALEAASHMATQAELDREAGRDDLAAILERSAAAMVDLSRSLTND